MIISTRNWLADLTAAARSIPATASGYAAENLWQGGTAQAWRSSVPATTHTFEFRATPSRPVDFAALFGVKPGGTATIASITLLRKSVWGAGTTTSVGTLTMSARGDGAIKLPVPIATETWVISVTLSVSALLTVGGMWLGLASTFSRNYATRRDQVTYHPIINVSEAQSVRTAELADYTVSFSLGFDRLRDSERNELLAIFHAARGGKQGIVMVPNSADLAGAHFGRLQPSLGYSIDFPVNEGLSLEFREDGRALNG